MKKNSTYQSRYSNSWALVIGINQYKHTSPLGYATNDARAVADILEKRFRFPKDNILLLLDEKATISAIREAFLGYANEDRIQPDDRLLVFFAGHGHTITGQRGEVGFLVPVDGKTEELHTLMRWDELTRNADLVSAKHIFFLMDACYGGLALLRRPAFGSMRFLGDMLQRYTRQVLTAGKADEVVADGNGVRPGHSIFTAHLLDALEGSASTKEGVITASGVMAYVYDRVACDKYSHQTPHYGFVDGDGDFIFDTSLLDRIRGVGGVPGMEKSEGEEERGEEDILINTSPQVTTILSPETTVTDTMKELLSDPAKRIRLDDFVSLHIRHFLDATDLRHFPIQGSNRQRESFVERLNSYEELSKNLQQIVILLAKWGDSDQLLLLEKMFTRLAEADKGSSGLVNWIKFTWYPIQILMYSAGIGALATRKYDVLRIIFQTPVQADSTSGKRLPLVIPVGTNMSELHELFKWLPGHERDYVPRSEHLFKALQPILEDLMFLGRSYEPLFDIFEVLFALVYADVTEHGWNPPGRFGWKHRRRYGEDPFNQVVEEAKKEKENWGPLRAGLFEGSLDKFLKNAEAYRELLNRLSWW